MKRKMLLESDILIRVLVDTFNIIGQISTILNRERKLRASYLHPFRHDGSHPLDPYVPQSTLASLLIEPNCNGEL
jgi:hypothetical protein